MPCCVLTGKGVIREGAACLLLLKKQKDAGRRLATMVTVQDSIYRTLHPSSRSHFLVVWFWFHPYGARDRTQGLMDAKHALSQPRSVLHSCFLHPDSSRSLTNRHTSVGPELMLRL